MPGNTILSVDHLSYTIDALPDEFDPVKRLWHLFKMGVKCESGYYFAEKDSLYAYYQAQGCVYKSHHVIKNKST